MKNYKSKILIIWGFFYALYSTTAFCEVIFRDKVIYKVGQKVFSLADLHQNFKDIHNLECMYDDSLLVKIFANEFNKSNKLHFAFKPELSEASKEYFKQLIHFNNILIYSNSQSVIVKTDIVKFLYLTAKRNKCDLSVFADSKTFISRFKHIIRLEVFVRSRFLPTEKGGKTTNLDLKKAIKSAKNLLNSVDRQLENEFYW